MAFGVTPPKLSHSKLRELPTGRAAGFHQPTARLAARQRSPSLLPDAALNELDIGRDVELALAASIVHVADLAEDRALSPALWGSCSGGKGVREGESAVTAPHTRAPTLTHTPTHSHPSPTPSHTPRPLAHHVMDAHHAPHHPHVAAGVPPIQRVPVVQVDAELNGLRAMQGWQLGRRKGKKSMASGPSDSSLSCPQPSLLHSRPCQPAAPTLPFHLPKFTPARAHWSTRGSSSPSTCA
jgi:hypothetical protein